MNYHRDHVKNFAEYVEPLHKLVSKRSEYKWTGEHHVAFENLKDSILNATMLNHPDPDETFILNSITANDVSFFPSENALDWDWRLITSLKN